VNFGTQVLHTSDDLDEEPWQPQHGLTKTANFEKLFKGSGSENDLSGDGLMTGSTRYENQLGFKSQTLQF